MDPYLPQVARDPDVMPGVVVELAVDRLHQRLEGAGAQVDDQPDGAALQGQVDVVGRLPRVQHEAVALERAEGESDLVRAALDGCQGQVVAEELVPFEGGHRLFPPWEKGRRREREIEGLMKGFALRF